MIKIEIEEELYDGKMYCKYCKRIINKVYKQHHKMTRRHQARARWYKYFQAIDEAIARLKKRLENGEISLDQFNAFEQEIYTEAEELDFNGHFKLLPDDD